MPASAMGARVTCISESFVLPIVVPARVGEESSVPARIVVPTVNCCANCELLCQLRVVVPIVVPARVGEESCVPARVVVSVVVISARVGVSK